MFPIRRLSDDFKVTKVRPRRQQECLLFPAGVVTFCMEVESVERSGSKIQQMNRRDDLFASEKRSFIYF